MLSVRTASHPALYRVNPASFRDGNGDGIGDLEGLIAALPYLKALSINGVLLPEKVAIPDSVQRQLVENGLGVWQDAAIGSVKQLQPLVRELSCGELAVDVVPYSIERLVSTLSARRDTLRQSVWMTGDAFQARVVSRWGQGDLRSASAYLTLLAMLPATICLYQGEELGLPHAAALEEPQGAQSPMPWHEAPEQATAGQLDWYQRVAIEHRAMAVSRQQQDEHSTLRYCQSLLKLRHLPLIQQGELMEVSQRNGMVRLVITHLDQCLEALINLQPYTQAAAPSVANMSMAWQLGAQAESHQWVIAGFGCAVFTRQEVTQEVFCESMGVTHG